MTNKKALRSQIIQIATMTPKELAEHAIKISISMLTEKEKGFLFRAIDEVKKYHGITESALAVCASVDLD